MTTVRGSVTHGTSARAWYAKTVWTDDPGPLPDRMPADATAAWIRRGDGMIGFGAIAQHHPRTIAEGQAWWDSFVTMINTDDGHAPVAFGTFTFDPGHTAVRPTMIVPEMIIGRKDGRGWVTMITDDPHAELRMPGRTAPPSPPVGVAYADGSLTGLQWEQVVAAAVRRIRAGELDKVVLARDLLATSTTPIDRRWLVRTLAQGYERCWTFYVDGLVGASPEMLVRREDGLATSRVLAGTIRRTGSADDDLALAAALSRSGKDLEEHEYAVRSVAEKLAPYCSGMNVPDSPYVLELPNVLHLATDVTGVANPHASSLTMAAALHPSAAVCGTPTDTARSVIAELERMDRERYSGVVGWVDASGDGEWAIALRCGQLDPADPRQLRLFAGCGIVAGSDPVAELAESNAKLVPMRDAVGG